MTHMDQRPRPILVAEDNEDHALFILRAFKKGGMVSPDPVFVVRDGVEAIEYLSGEGKFKNREEYPLPMLLLLDLKMPNKDGFEVLEWVREQPGLRRLRIVVLTTQAEINEVNRAYELGANSFLVKPTNMEDFFNLTEALKRYWLWMSAEPELVQGRPTWQNLVSAVSSRSASAGPQMN
jgi:CheY-like chemotaxis protein